MITYRGYCWGGPDDGKFVVCNYPTIHIVIRRSISTNWIKNPDLFETTYETGRYRYNQLQDRWVWEKIVPE